MNSDGRYKGLTLPHAIRKGEWLLEKLERVRALADGKISYEEA